MTLQELCTWIILLWQRRFKMENSAPCLQSYFHKVIQCRDWLMNWTCMYLLLLKPNQHRLDTNPWSFSEFPRLFLLPVTAPGLIFGVLFSKRHVQTWKDVMLGVTKLFDRVHVCYVGDYILWLFTNFCAYYVGRHRAEYFKCTPATHPCYFLNSSCGWKKWSKQSGQSVMVCQITDVDPGMFLLLPDH